MPSQNCGTLVWITTQSTTRPRKLARRRFMCSKTETSSLPAMNVSIAPSSECFHSESPRPLASGLLCGHSSGTRSRRRCSSSRWTCSKSERLPQGGRVGGCSSKFVDDKTAKPNAHHVRSFPRRCGFRQHPSIAQSVAVLRLFFFNYSCMMSERCPASLPCYCPFSSVSSSKT